MENYKLIINSEKRELAYLATDKNLECIDPIKFMIGGPNKCVSTKYVPDQLVYNLIRKYGIDHNGISLDKAIGATKFILVDKLFGMAGITLGTTVALLKDYVARHPCIVINGKVDATLPSLIYHELVHVSQVLNDGTGKFLAKYIWQWVKSGFSYDNMKNIGYEKQAYTAQYELQDMINSFGI